VQRGDHGQGPGDGLEGFLLGWNAEQEFCDSADDHHAAADEIADEQPERVVAGADQRAVQDGAVARRRGR
jgi:hypothetical protein